MVTVTKPLLASMTGEYFENVINLEPNIYLEVSPTLQRLNSKIYMTFKITKEFIVKINSPDWHLFFFLITTGKNYTI